MHNIIAVYNGPKRERIEGLSELPSPGDILVRGGQKYYVASVYAKSYKFGPNSTETHLHLIPFDETTEHIYTPQQQQGLTKEELIAVLDNEQASIDAMVPDDNDGENDVTLSIRKDLWKSELRAIRMAMFEALEKTKKRREIMFDIPDHPVIQNCERTGYPDGKTPTEPTCPVCGEVCEDVYEDRAGDIVGCDQCLTMKSANDALATDD